MIVGFVGFGEANSSIAAGLYDEGLRDMICYDAMQKDPKVSEKIVQACNRSGCRQMDSAEAVCKEADIVMASVPSTVSEKAAMDAANGIHPGMIYADLSTATPRVKKRISQIVEARGGTFVDGAMMGTLLKDRHQVSMLLCGSGASAFMEAMKPYHMRQSVVEGEPGTATSIKFIRSITAKGLSCLLLESLQAAQHFGVEEIIVDSFLDSFGAGFEKIVDGYLSGVIIHANRREHEMENVVEFLREEGLPYSMSDATREKIHWIQDEKIKEQFENGVGRSWRAVLNGWKM